MLSGCAFRRKVGPEHKDSASQLLRKPSKIRLHREYVKHDTLFGEVLTHLTLNLHYSIGDEGAFLGWLNYVISQSSISPAGSRKAQRARSVKYYLKDIYLLLDGECSVDVENRITHDGSVGPICFPQPVRVFSSFLRRTIVEHVSYSLTLWRYEPRLSRHSLVRQFRFQSQR